MKLNIVSTKPPRWFLYDDYNVELAQRADPAFYEEAIQGTRKGKSVHDTLLRMEAVRLGVAPTKEQEAAGITVTVIKVEPHEHEDYLRGMPVHDHAEYVHDHTAYATTEEVRGVLKDVDEVDLARVANNEAIQRRLDQHEAAHTYAAVLHNHEELAQRLGALEKLIAVILERLDGHDHVGLSPLGHSHDELVVVNDQLRTLRNDLGIVGGQVDKQGRVAAPHEHRELATKDELEAHLSQDTHIVDAEIVSFKDIGAGRRRAVVEYAVKDKK